MFGFYKFILSSGSSIVSHFYDSCFSITNRMLKENLLNENNCHEVDSKTSIIQCNYIIDYISTLPTIIILSPLRYWLSFNIKQLKILFCISSHALCIQVHHFTEPSMVLYGHSIHFIILFLARKNTVLHIKYKIFNIYENKKMVLQELLDTGENNINYSS